MKMHLTIYRKHQIEKNMFDNKRFKTIEFQPGQIINPLFIINKTCNLTLNIISLASIQRRYLYGLSAQITSIIII